MPGPWSSQCHRWGPLHRGPLHIAGVSVCTDTRDPCAYAADGGIQIVRRLPRGGCPRCTGVRDQAARCARVVPGWCFQARQGHGRRIWVFLWRQRQASFRMSKMKITAGRLDFFFQACQPGCPCVHFPNSMRSDADDPGRFWRGPLLSSPVFHFNSLLVAGRISSSSAASAA